MRITRWTAALLAVVGALSATQPGRADVITFVTPAGSATSGPVMAEADITTGAGTVTVVLKNLTVDPGDVAQNLSALTLTFSNAVGANSLSSSSSVERTVAGGGTYTPGSTVATGWLETSATSVLKVDDLGGAGPAHTIIGAPAGDNKYDSANNSIAGNKPHNLFLDETATFVVSAAGVTADTTVTAATFQFGTTDGAGLILGQASVPEPSVVTLSALSLLTFGTVAGLRRRIRRKAV
jgi:hypothetical protein